jgi:hypothetical protein
MTNRVSNTSLSVTNAAGFPKAGGFILEQVDAITSRILTPDINEVITKTANGRLIHDVQKYNYTSRIVLSTLGSSIEGSNQLTVTSVAGLANGMTIFMDGFREDAVITNILGLVVTSSVSSTKTLNNTAVEFGGNTLTGITPNLPALSGLNEQTLTALSRTGGTVTCTTPVAHNYLVGDTVIINGGSGINILSTTGDVAITSNLLSNLASTAGIAPAQLIFGPGIPADTKVLAVLSPTQVSMTKNATLTTVGASLLFNEDVNGSHKVQSITATQFTYNLLGTNGVAITAGTSRVERQAISNTDSKVIITESQSSDDTRIKGTYIWDLTAPYVLSFATASTQDLIQAGKIVRLINVSANEIPNETGFLIFNYGRNNQEGPIKYLYKPADNTIALDPSYVFQHTHAIGSPMVVIRHKGPHIMDTRAGEYGPYITDPSEAREILKDLIKSVKSAGIFVNFLIRFPEQLYGTLDVYNSGTLP